MIISEFGIIGYPVLEFVTNSTKFISELQRASIDLSDSFAPTLRALGPTSKEGLTTLEGCTELDKHIQTHKTKDIILG